MKANFKRLLSAVAALAMTATCMVATSVPTTSADEAVNLAIGATATADSDNTQYLGHVTAQMNDGDYDTRWQSNSKGTSVETMAWAQLDFGAQTTFNKLAVYYENARPTVAGTTIKVSVDGNEWTTVTATAGEETNVKNPAGGDMWLVEFNFDAQTAQYVKLEFTEGKDNGKGGTYECTSIWELEVFNEAAATPTGSFGMAGAQVRAAGEAYDLRFITNFSSDLYADLANITDLGVIMVRADELEAVGKTVEDINLDLAADDLTVKKVTATYLRNVDLATTGNYTYTVTITGITNVDTQYVCVGYYTTAAGTTYTEALTKCVADGIPG